MDSTHETLSPHNIYCKYVLTNKYYYFHGIIFIVLLPFTLVTNDTNLNGHCLSSG